MSELRKRSRPKENDTLDLDELERIKKDYSGKTKKIRYIHFYSHHIEFTDGQWNTIYSPRYIEDEKDLYSFSFDKEVGYRKESMMYDKYFYENLAIISKYLLKKGYTLEEDDKVFVKTSGRK